MKESPDNHKIIEEKLTQSTLKSPLSKTGRHDLEPQGQ
jgi:hypothetical protein